MIHCVVRPHASPALPWNQQEALGTLSRTGSLDLSGAGRVGPIGGKYGSIRIQQKNGFGRVQYIVYISISTFVGK